MGDYLTTILDTTAETSTPSYSFRIRWRDGRFALLVDFLSATLTFCEELTGAIVNGREHQNILNANQVVMANVTEEEVTFCKITWTLTAADTTCLTTRELEYHQATFIFVKTGSEGERCPFAVRFPILNLLHVP